MSKSDKYNNPVVIVGLNEGGLSIARSLGRKGISIIGLYDKNSPNYYLKSKYYTLRFESPLRGDALIESLMSKVAGYLKEPAVLFCTTDESVLTITKYEEQLRPFYKSVFPPYEVTASQISKRGFYEFTSQHSFLAPSTYFSREKAELVELCEKIIFPCVIKPEIKSLAWTQRVPPRDKVLFVTSKQDFLNTIKKYQLQDIPLIIQEWIEGNDDDVYFCMSYIGRNSQPLALCTGRKLRQYPQFTGTLSIGETVWMPDLADESVRLFRTADYKGFCSLEFKLSKKDGRFYIIEPTVGRPDAIEGIVISAGIDIVYIAYLDALEKSIEPSGHTTKEIKWIDEPRELYFFQNYCSNRSQITDFLSSYKGKRYYSLWCSRDPMPALTFLSGKLRKASSRLFGL